MYHRLFAALMVRIGSSVGVEPIKKQDQVNVGSSAGQSV